MKAQEQAPMPPGDETGQIILVSVHPDEKLERQFMGETGWTGADGAGSVPLSAEKTLWLFGDTFIGKVENGRRCRPQFINNSAAWQNSVGEPRLRFFWRTEGDTAAALVTPLSRDGQFYWPCDGKLIGERLFLFMRRVKIQSGASGPFDFDVLGCDLVIVENPQAEPTAWKYRTMELPLRRAGIEAVSAVASDRRYLYVYGRLLPQWQGRRMKPGQLAVARVPVNELQYGRPRRWQYLCDTAEGALWRSRPDNLKVLFDDAAPEMSISAWPGIPGYVALYMSPLDVPGDGRTIFVRHADRLWGPWSERTLVYSCPPPAAGLIVYNARSHPELSVQGAVPVTFCRNSLRNADHDERAELYRPQAIAVKLRPGTIAPIRRKP